jgi:hypothetical protein
MRRREPIRRRIHAPHLSVGQAHGEDELRAFRRDLEKWTPLAFAARSVTIIVREPPPDDVFRPLAEVTFA